MDLPIFPLNGAVLFPDTNLPLNIFVKRNIEMVNYSLSKNRYIGMIQVKENNELYDIGCLGKIYSFNETNDGRYLISLQGIDRFKIIKEIKQSYSFRLVNAEIISNNQSENTFSENQKFDLLDKYRNYIESKKLNINLNEFENVEMSQMIKFVAMISPFKDIDKQVLLETQNIADFYNKLLSIIELELVSDFNNQTIN